MCARDRLRVRTEVREARKATQRADRTMVSVSTVSVRHAHPAHPASSVHQTQANRRILPRQIIIPHPWTRIRTRIRRAPVRKALRAAPVPSRRAPLAPDAPARAAADVAQPGRAVPRTTLSGERLRAELGRPAAESEA